MSTSFADIDFCSTLSMFEASMLPVILVEGETGKLAGMVSSQDVLEGIIMGRRVNKKDEGALTVEDE